MKIPLETFANCFQGLLPAQLFTCSLDGVPNAAYLSHVEYVDADHVALSFQFFNKSRRNIAENPRATVNVLDPDTGQGWSLHLHYERSESAGALFDRMALRIEAIASYCGLKGVFRLRAADVYRVLDIEPLAEECGSPRAGASQHSDTLDPVFTVRALQDIAPGNLHTYGREATTKTSAFSTQLLDKVRNADLDSSGDKLGEVVRIARSLNLEGISARSRVPVIGGLIDRLKASKGELVQKFSDLWLQRLLTI